ncbi:MAG: hydrogenase 4 subunit B [Acidobacteria bacterium]|nr:hydrogenase 4 subunit B [Acidobacteriota bacterium]
MESVPVYVEIAPVVVLMFAAPAVGVLTALAWRSGRGARRLSLASAFVGCVAALLLGADVLHSGTTWTWRSDALLQPLGGVSLRLDPLSAFFVMVIAFTGAPASLYASGYLRHLDRGLRGRATHALFNVFLAAMWLVPLAANVATFLFAWELMAVSSYLLVVSDPDQEGAMAAGAWYAAMTHAGFLALLAAFVILAGDGPWELEAMRANAAALPPPSLTAAVLLALVAFGSKAGLVPLHVWLPRAHPAAPSHVSALMSAAMVKLGVYGTIRVLFDLLPPLSPWWGGTLLAVGVATALTGVLYSVAESHLKRVLAYSTVENVGIVFVALGFALLMRGYGNGALAAMGLVVALLHTLNHALFKSLLFLCAGAVVHAARAASLEAFGGLIRRMPITAMLCLVGVLGLAAVPPLNGFPSEWLTFQLLLAGARFTEPSLAITLPLALAASALVAGLAAVSAVRLFGITFLALPRTDGARDAHEASATMRTAMAIPAAACLVLGLVPTSVLTRLTAIVSELGLPMGNLDTGLALALPLVGSRLWPVALAALVAGAALAAGLAALAARTRDARIDAAWNCGRLVQSPRTEYTAAAFAEPLKRVFTGFYQPAHEVTVDVHPVSPYFVRAMTVRADLAPWMEQTLYAPIVRAARRTADWAARMHTGSIHWYLALLPIALLLLLLIARWIG